jgi:KUP system potassium uptake protein
MRTPHTDPREDKKNTGYLALGALGIVFGDIGTSPIYAVQACFSHGLRPEPANVLGVISLILWGLTVVVSPTIMAKAACFRCWPWR